MITLACALGTQLYAQKMTDMGAGNGGSPHVKAEWTIDGAAIGIEYGRPSLKGRPESQLMPAGKVAHGADVATTITSSKPLTFGPIRSSRPARLIRSTPSPARRGGSSSSASSISPGSGAFRISRRWRSAVSR